MSQSDSSPLTVQQFADQFSVHVQTAYRWVRDGRVRSVRISPRVIRIPQSEVSRLMAETVEEAPGE